MNKLDLGAVTAYAMAVEKGYEGTEEEFAALQAESGNNAVRAEAAADRAQNILDSIPLDFQEVSQGVATLTEEKLNVQTGKNIFNKDTPNQINGFYFMFSDGTRQPADGYSATVVKVKGGEMLSFNTHNLHVCALSAVPDLSYYANNYGVLDGYLEGFADALPKQGYIVPDNAVCLVVSCKTEELSTLQIENGDHSTPYESYVTGVRPTTIIDGVDSRMLIVGGGWYDSITDAFKDAKDGDTIFVMPGTYTETVNARSKNVKIKGFSRDACILTYPSSDYFYPPLEMAKGVVEDMTIIATGTELAEGATMLAYCVHVDWNEQEGKSLQFRNCRFVGEVRSCVGIGTRRNSRVSFVGCEFECGTDACVYLHEDQVNDSIQQYVEFIDCTMKANYAGPVIRMQETPALTNNLATVRFQRNILTNLGGDTVVMQQYGTQPGLNGNGFLGATNWSLDNASALNSDTVIDAQ